jgi:arylsulfatase A-like enzyme
MAEHPSKSRLKRAFGAALLTLVAIGALWSGHSRWMTGVPASAFAPGQVRLDLAEAFRFAVHRAGPAGARPRRADDRVTLPPGSAVSWSVQVPPRGPGFGATAIELDGAGDGADSTAVLEVASDEGQRRRFALPTCASACRVPLDEFSGRVARITARGPAPGRPPLVLVRPVLYGAPPTATPRSAPLAQRPPVIVYLIDTLRADKLGTYGNERGLTPHIDAFAATATVFDQAIAQAPWTKPSVASIFTGLFARVHRIMTMQGALPDSAVTLAELFLAHGYATGAVVTNGLVDADFGFDQGFEHFVREKGHAPDVEGITGYRADKPAIDSDIAQAAVWPWLDGLEPGVPFLLYLHVLDPHAPHFPPEPFKQRFVPELDRFDLGSMESVRRMDEAYRQGQAVDAREQAQFETLYDAEIAHNDYQFGLFLDELRARGIYDEALIVLVSDHGEEFWEHGQRGHGKTLHEELLRVPLIVKAPHQTEGRHIRSLAQHVDLMPTLADYANVAVPAGGHGSSLRPLIERGDAAREGRPARIGVSAGTLGTAIRQGSWKLVKRSNPRHPLALYDLAADPGETRNLAHDHPIRVRYLLEEVARIEARTSSQLASDEPEEREISEEKAAELRALGYID